MALVVAGVDPGLGPRRTGIAIVVRSGSKWVLIETRLVSLEEAAGILEALRPHVVAVDSPLSPPPPGSPWRRVDLLGKRLGLRLLPPGWKGMRRMVMRVVQLLVERGLPVIETHPSSVVRVSGCRSAEVLVALCFDVVLARPASRDEWDAAVSACVARMYAEGRIARIEASDGSIWLVEPGLCG